MHLIWITFIIISFVLLRFLLLLLCWLAHWETVDIRYYFWIIRIMLLVESWTKVWWKIHFFCSFVFSFKFNLGFKWGQFWSHVVFRKWSGKATMILPSSKIQFKGRLINVQLVSSLQPKVCDSVTGATKGHARESVNFLRQPLMPEELYLGWITSSAQYNLTFGPQGSLTASLANDSVTVGLRPRWNRLKRTKHVFAVKRWPGKTDLIKLDLIAGYDLTASVIGEWTLSSPGECGEGQRKNQRKDRESAAQGHGQENWPLV